MSSVSIVRDTRTLIQSKLLPAVNPKWLPQFQFGMEAFCLRPFQSAGSNARSVVVNANTAASKTLRLLRNLKLADHLGIVFDTLGLIRPGDYVNVDHSDMNGLTALVGARQTRNSSAMLGLDSANQDGQTIHVRVIGIDAVSWTTRLSTSKILPRRLAGLRFLSSRPHLVRAVFGVSEGDSDGLGDVKWVRFKA